MDRNGELTKTPAPATNGSYDLSDLPAVMRAVDLAMRHYFGATDWLANRNKLFPVSRRRP